MNNPFDYIPDAACREAYLRLTSHIRALQISALPEDAAFCRELESGKMLGVLIASDAEGTRHTLYAFSGQLGSGGFCREGFVGPVFDYLRPDGHFKTGEACISRLNREIDSYVSGTLAMTVMDYECRRKEGDAEIALYKEQCRISNAERESRRASGMADEAELAAMIRQSQYEKAELRRRKRRVAEALEPFADRLSQARSRLEEMKERRRRDSEELQQWLFDHTRVLNARGESRSLSQIFADTPLRVPPSGAGECCAPKLLQAAYRQGWHPIALAEYWYGRPKEGEVRIAGEHYPACRGKCLPVLGWMLQGLEVVPPLDAASAGQSLAGAAPEIVYENEWFCVVSKPSGMLSVPGKGRAVSVQQWLTDRYGADRMVKVAHRLDQDTSGLLIATFGNEAYRRMQSLFATRQVKKEYEALLEGDYRALGHAKQGHISLPLSADWLDRPRQRIDHTGGKEAATDYEFIRVEGSRSRITMRPLTGRTHQLRVHAASADGLGMPISGDRLYGVKNGISTGGRLYLHARSISFIFPADGREYRFDLPVPF